MFGSRDKAAAKSAAVDAALERQAVASAPCAKDAEEAARRQHKAALAASGYGTCSAYSSTEEPTPPRRHLRSVK
jgi:hypothetical protein